MTECILADYLRDILDAIDKVAELVSGDDFDSLAKLPSCDECVLDLDSLCRRGSPSRRVEYPVRGFYFSTDAYELGATLR